jgi:molybdopterin-dependent oxidoreductase-like protein protein
MRSPARLVRRAGRRTNLALLLLLIGAFLTGWLAFAAATPPRSTAATVAHGLLGLGVVALVPWKSVIISRARLIWIASIGLIGVIAVCLLSGFAQVFGGYRIVAGISPLQVHVGSAIVAVPLLTWHVLRHRIGRQLRRTDMSRRNLLRTGAFALGTGASYAALEGAGALAGLPSARRISTGSHQLDPLARPATIWLFDRVPALGPAHPVNLAGTLMPPADLASRSRTVRARLDCTGGWFTDADWTAVPLGELIPPERLESAASLVVTSVTGYRRGFPAREAGNLWLATGCEGRPLTPGTGAPVRLVVPNRRGFWWVKWVASVELSDRPALAQPPFPLQ